MSKLFPFYLQKRCLIYRWCMSHPKKERDSLETVMLMNTSQNLHQDCIRTTTGMIRRYQHQISPGKLHKSEEEEEEEEEGSKVTQQDWLNVISNIIRDNSLHWNGILEQLLRFVSQSLTSSLFIFYNRSSIIDVLVVREITEIHPTEQAVHEPKEHKENTSRPYQVHNHLTWLWTRTMATTNTSRQPTEHEMKTRETIERQSFHQNQ